MTTTTSRGAPGFQSTRPRGARHLGANFGYFSLSFNPRARAGRDHGRRVPRQFSTCFNPRARAGRDVPSFSRVSLEKSFQSTRPRGARRGLVAGLRSLRGFNPRARAGRDICDRGISSCRARFNPRARAGRDLDASFAVSSRLVSIHAPARGATLRFRQATLHGAFQSTRPRGARLHTRCRHAKPRRVSIHAPARGATRVNQGPMVWTMFQSTRPRGARHRRRRRLRPRSWCFNPRARAGRDSA